MEPCCRADVDLVRSGQGLVERCSQHLRYARKPRDKRDGAPSRSSPRHAQHTQPHAFESPSPAGSVKKLKKQIRGLKAAQTIPGQTPADMAAREQQIDGLEYDLEERQRKKRKTGRWS